jgi:hypothetical protein
LEDFGLGVKPNDWSGLVEMRNMVLGRFLTEAARHGVALLFVGLGREI